MHVFIHLRSPWGYVWMCYFGLNQEQWWKIDYIVGQVWAAQRASSYDYATCIEGSPVVRVPWFCQVPALSSWSFTRKTEKKLQTHTLPFTDGWISPRPWNCPVQWVPAWELEAGCLGLPLGSASSRVVKFISLGLYFCLCERRIWKGFLLASQ